MLVLLTQASTLPLSLAGMLYRLNVRNMTKHLFVDTIRYSAINAFNSGETVWSYTTFPILCLSFSQPKRA